MKHLLVIHDMPSVGKRLMELLESTGHTVRHVTDCAGARQALTDSAYDAIIVDPGYCETEDEGEDVPDCLALLDTLKLQVGTTPIRMVGETWYPTHALWNQLLARNITPVDITEFDPADV